MRKKPSGTISAKALQDRIRSAKADLTGVDEQLNALFNRRSELEVRITTLLELLHDVKPDNVEAAAAPAKSMTEAAIDYLAEHPGVRASEVVNALIKLPSTAKDPRKNLHQTIINLRNRGRIEKLPDGGLKVATNGTAPKP